MLAQARQAGAPDGVAALQLNSQGQLAVTAPTALFSELAPQALAASAQLLSAVMDLGIVTAATRLVGIKSGVAAANENLAIQCSTDGVSNWVTTVADTTASSLASNGTSAAVMPVQGLATARYARLVYVNGLSAQAAVMLRLAALPGA